MPRFDIDTDDALKKNCFSFFSKGRSGHSPSVQFVFLLPPKTYLFGFI